MALLLSLLLFTAGDSLAGRDAFSRLEFGVGVRELAIGGAATACCNSAAAAFWNPAALAGLSKGSVASSYQFNPLGSSFADDRDVSATLAWGQPLGGFAALGFVLDHLRLGGIECRQIEQPWPDGFIDYSETMAALGASFWMMPGLSVGVSGIAYLEGYSAIGGNAAYPGMTATGFSGQFGLHYAPLRFLRIGLSGRLPATLNWGSEWTPDLVPQRMAFGLAALPVRGLTLAAELDSRTNRAYNLSAGGEYSVTISRPRTYDLDAPLLAASIRAGLKDGIGFGSEVAPAPALTAGGGVEFGKAGFQLALDYVVVYQSVFRDRHSLGLTVSY